MNQKQLIESIKELKEIKPRKEWAYLLKSQILAGQTKEVVLAQKIGFFDVISNFKFQISNLFSRRLAYAFATLVFLLVGIFGFARYTVPGDLLFPVKRISEQIQSPLQVAYNRSEDLVQIVKENKTENISPAISEFKASIADAAKNLVASLSQNNDKNSIKQVADEVKKIQDNQKQLQTLGIDIGQTKEAKDLDTALSSVVASQLLDLKKTTLTDGQQKSLTEAQDLYNQGKYADALEEILLINK